jgi:hypothetical protein
MLAIKKYPAAKHINKMTAVTTLLLIPVSPSVKYGINSFEKYFSMQHLQSLKKLRSLSRMAFIA